MSSTDEETDAPEAVDLRDLFRPAGDQGRRGTCVAFAVTAVHEVDRSPGGAIPDDLAEEVLFWGAKQIDGDAREGTRFSSADSALRRWGQPAEELWPYDEDRDHRAPDYSPPLAAIEAPNCHTTALRPVPAVRDFIEAELVGGRPIVLGIPLWESLRKGEGQPIPAPTASELYPTRHAVVVAGFDRASAALLVRNSWGPRWGEDGYAWVDAGLLAFATGAWAVDPLARAPTHAHDPVLLERNRRELE